MLIVLYCESGSVSLVCGKRRCGVTLHHCAIYRNEFWADILFPQDRKRRLGPLLMSLELLVTLTLEVQCVAATKGDSKSVCAKTRHCPLPSGQKAPESRKRRREADRDAGISDSLPVLKKTVVEHVWVEKKVLPPHLSTVPEIRLLPNEIQTFLVSHWADQEQLLKTAGEEIRQELTQTLREQQVRRVEWSSKNQGVVGLSSSWSGEQSDSEDRILGDCEVQASCTEGISIG